MIINKYVLWSLICIGVIGMAFSNVIGSGSYNSGHFGDSEFVNIQWITIIGASVIWVLGIIGLYLMDKYSNKKKAKVNENRR